MLDQLPSKQRQTVNNLYTKFLSIFTVIFLKVLLDPSMTKGRSREWKELQTALSKVSSLVKVHQLYQEYIHVHFVSLSLSGC